MTHAEARSDRVLIVEDDWLLAAQLEIWLRDNGFEVVGLAPTFEEAVSLAENRKPDVAILDFNLRGVSAAPLVEMFGAMDMKIVIVTGYEKPCAPDGTVVAVLQKPTTKGELLKAVAEAGLRAGAARNMTPAQVAASQARNKG